MYGGEWEKDRISIHAEARGSERADAECHSITTGHDGARGPPRAGLGAQGAAQNLPVPNLPGANGNGDAGSAPAEKFSLFVGGIPISLSDARLQQLLEVSYLHFSQHASLVWLAHCCCCSRLSGQYSVCDGSKMPQECRKRLHS